MRIKILIADNHKIFREAVGSLLSNEPDMEIVGEAEDGRTAVQLALKLQPNVITMEISMPNLNGIDATSQITREMPKVKTIALSACRDKCSVREMLKAGASGYVTKECAFEELIAAIRDVASNQIYLCSQVSKVVIDGFINRLSKGDDSVYSVLTRREREVLQLIAEGKSTKVIAKELGLSAKTVEWHRSQLMKKLGIQSIAELVKYAINEGLTCSYSYA
jgi:DNA-binding NarL/FixJ family response regulator